MTVTWQIIVLFLSVYFFVTIALTLVWFGTSLWPSKLKLPFLEVDIQNFHNLSIVRMFKSVSRSLFVFRDADAEKLFQESRLVNHPEVLIHLASNFVCDAYISAFRSFPTDASLHENASKLGAQNIGFIKLFRDMDAAALKHSSSVGEDFPREFFLRAPSMVQRISPDFVDHLTISYLRMILVRFNIEEFEKNTSDKSDTIKVKFTKL